MMTVYAEACRWCRALERIFVLLVYAALGAVMSGIIYFVFIDSDTPEVQTASSWVNDKGQIITSISRRDQVFSRRTICGNRVTPTTVWRRLEDVNTSSVYPLPPVFVMTWIGCKTITTPLPLPLTLPVGTFRYVVVPQYEINILQHRSISLPIPDLEVTE